MRAASRGEIRKKPGSKRSTSSRKPPRRQLGASADEPRRRLELRAPARWLADRLAAAASSSQYAAGVAAPREAARHADDRDRLVRLASRCGARPARCFASASIVGWSHSSVGVERQPEPGLELADEVDRLDRRDAVARERLAMSTRSAREPSGVRRSRVTSRSRICFSVGACRHLTTPIAPSR